MNEYKKLGKIVLSAINKDGTVYVGKTHAECLKQADKGYLRNAEQGFVTEKGIFLNREEALKVAQYFNQIKFKHPPMGELLSEDIF